jgi:hypothetical protein
VLEPVSDGLALDSDECVAQSSQLVSSLDSGPRRRTHRERDVPQLDRAVTAARSDLVGVELGPRDRMDGILRLEPAGQSSQWRGMSSAEPENVLLLETNHLGVTLT